MHKNFLLQKRMFRKYVHYRAEIGSAVLRDIILQDIQNIGLGPRTRDVAPACIVSSTKPTAVMALSRYETKRAAIKMPRDLHRDGVCRQAYPVGVLRQHGAGKSL